MKLYKDRMNKKLCGVCAGIADAFGLDVTLVRVITALLGVFTGFGVVLYLICAVVFPDKSSV